MAWLLFTASRGANTSHPHTTATRRGRHILGDGQPQRAGRPTEKGDGAAGWVAGTDGRRETREPRAATPPRRTGRKHSAVCTAPDQLPTVDVLEYMYCMRRIHRQSTVAV